MLVSSTHCKIRCTSILPEIVSILDANSLVTQSSCGILIGSRAARYYLPNFRGTTEDNDADWDIISSSTFFLEWLSKQGETVKTIDMIIPTSNENEQLDVYVCCTRHDQSKYDFTIPQSLTSYTTHILNNPEIWTSSFSSFAESKESCRFKNASVKLLLILKKYMLYYTHQWEKTAKDYRQLLVIAEPLTHDDAILCDLFVAYNEKLHGKRPLDMDKFIFNPGDTREGIIISRNDFSTQDKDEKISVMYQTAMSMSTVGDILIGLEYICTQSTLWLADYVINNWVTIQNEKFKQKRQHLVPCIKFEVENYCLFPQIPEIATQQILRNIINSNDFYSMQLVCKRWYTILRQESFWRDLYISRYGGYSVNADHVYSWKMLYFVRLEEQIMDDKSKFEQLAYATIQLRQITANDILRLWEELTRQHQFVEPIVLSKINYILLNSLYYHMEETSSCYSVKLVIFGLEDAHSRSTVHLTLQVGEYGFSHFSDHMEELSVECNLQNSQPRVLTFRSPALFGFYKGKWGYVTGKSSLLQNVSNAMSPAPTLPVGLLNCLFIMMVHPAHRAQFIKYLITLENHCSNNRCSYNSYFNRR